MSRILANIAGSVKVAVFAVRKVFVRDKLDVGARKFGGH
jgi:hypothetical protein